MTDLFNCPVLLIDQPSPQPGHQITDAQGSELARTVQVGGERKSAVKRFFSPGDRSRVVVQGTRPGGAAQRRRRAHAELPRPRSR